jgi:hypothetical protein
VGGHQIVERRTMSVKALQESPVARKPAQILIRTRP